MWKTLKALCRNLPLKFAALFLAVATWYYLATAGQEIRRFERVAVAFVSQPEDVARLSPPPRPVAVTLEGPRGLLDAIEVTNLMVVIDLGNVKLEQDAPVKSIFELVMANIREGGDPARSKPLRRGVGLVRVEPPTVTLTLNRRTEVELPVEVVTEGVVAQGFALEHRVEPEQVVARGPAEALRGLTSIPTKAVSVDGLTEGFQRPVALVSQVETEEFGPVAIELSRPSVVVTVAVSESPKDKAIKGVPVELVGEQPDVLAVIQQDITTVALTLRGPPSLLGGLDERSVVAEVDLKETTPPNRGPALRRFPIGAGSIRKVIEHGSLPLPRQVEVVAVKPEAVQLTLDRVESRVLAVKARLDGEPPEDYEVTEVIVLPEKVEVRGPASLLAQLKAIETEAVHCSKLKDRERQPGVLLATKVSVGEFRDVPLRPKPAQVTVVVAVAERRVRKTLNGLPISLLVAPDVAANVRVETDRQKLGPVAFEGPKSDMKAFGPDSVVAFVRVKAGDVTAGRPTIRAVEFHVRAPRVHLAFDHEAIPITLKFPPRKPETPTAPPDEGPGTAPPAPQLTAPRAAPAPAAEPKERPKAAKPKDD